MYLKVTNSPHNHMKVDSANHVSSSTMKKIKACLIILILSINFK